MGKLQITHNCVFLDTPAGPLKWPKKIFLSPCSSYDTPLNPLPQRNLPFLNINSTSPLSSLSPSPDLLCVDPVVHEHLGGSGQAEASQIGNRETERGVWGHRSVCYDSSLLADPESGESIDDFCEEVAPVGEPVVSDCISEHFNHKLWALSHPIDEVEQLV
ncbi:hypothetical protein O181_037067 [Austropuccinia psidii MF-1]|uniref:Uncharacterized protein n=1 Tax=Austropuccinia psidii MF-1 TaxID=1389203 RepID=A0A9Q3HAI8_9BASI|nr:hypothetical protein [Austropuccinia psidii MF-1]